MTSYADSNERFPQPPPGHRDWYSFEALRMLPRIILMVDKNRFSDTYGCFDREFWHYKTVDFPCGMNQEFCLPLALAYAYDFPHNPYYGNERLKELVVASIEFTRDITHPDGSTDDYFPFEKALGAHVFSTYAMTESYLELELDRPDLVDFFRMRADWLCDNNETGQLANHQAFAALALYNVFLVTGDEKYRKHSNAFRDITLSWQHDAGWFQEYEGADPGYHSCSIAFLSKLWLKSRDDLLMEPLERAVEFAAYFMHPDGSYAGEYGSRNTFHFYPHGFEVLSPFFPTAGRIAETYLTRSMPERRRYFNDDNRMCAHYVYDWMQSWRDYNEDRSFGLLEDSREPFARYFDEAKMYVKKTDAYYAVVNLSKGGVIKVFNDDGPVYSDTGLMARTEDDTVIVSHLVDDENIIKVDEDAATMTVSGKMSKRRSQLSSPVKQIAFRGMNLSVGRYDANLVRSVLQKILITGKPRTDVRFRRRLRFTDDAIFVQDSVDATADPTRFVDLARGSDSTSIYVANSNTFQESVLLPWADLSGELDALNRDGFVEMEEEKIVGA